MMIVRAVTGDSCIPRKVAQCMAASVKNSS